MSYTRVHIYACIVFTTLTVGEEGGGEGSQSSSLLSIVTNQRERFKQRKNELEIVQPYIFNKKNQLSYSFISFPGVSTAKANSYSTTTRG